jgi:hypothetical protein
MFDVAHAKSGPDTTGVEDYPSAENKRLLSISSDHLSKKVMSFGINLGGMQTEFKDQNCSVDILRWIFDQSRD